VGSNAPPPPDYTGAANTAAAASKANTQAQTQANRPNQNTGFASGQWTQNPDGSWTQNVGLNGQLGQAQGMSQEQLLQGLGQPLDTGESARQQAVGNMYGAETANLDPQFRLAHEQTDAALANEGLAPTSEAARAQQNQLGQQENQAYAGARANAEQLGNQAQQLTYEQNVNSRELPLQELQGMLGLEAQPGFQGAGVAQAPDLLGAAAAAGNYGLQANQQNNQLMGALGSGAGQLFGSFMGALPLF
jgi:hypothetical protein